MQTVAVRAQVQVTKAQAQKPAARVVAVPRFAKALGAGVASLALALSANAATVKVGCRRAWAGRLPRGPRAAAMAPASVTHADRARGGLRAGARAIR